MDTLQTTHAAPVNAFEREVASMDPWFHNLHLPEGQTAPGHPLGDFPSFKWKQIEPHLPASLEGWTALDVGCNAGYYSFELARRGAQVSGIDIDNHYLSQAEWAAEKLGLQDRVAFKRQTVYEAGAQPDRYDLVWFMGVFYHLRYPILALDLLARKASRLFVFQSLTLPQPSAAKPIPDDLKYEERDRLTDPSWPSMALVERRFAGDPTNWWVASSSALEALLRTAGMEVIARPDAETFVCRPQPQSPEVREERALAVAELAAASRAFGISDRVG